MLFLNCGVHFISVIDNGPSFTSADFKLFTTKNSIKHSTTAPYHPSSNGPAKQAVQTFKTAMKRGIENGPVDINTVIWRYMLSYCNTPQTSTNLSPAELVYKRILNTRLNLLKLQTNKGTLK